jgi:hypothetical protein
MENFIIWAVLMKTNKEALLQSFYLKTIKRQEAEIQGLLHPGQANLGYFLAWFQSLQLPSTQSESPLAPKSHVSFKVSTQLRTEFFSFHISILIVRYPE